MWYLWYHYKNGKYLKFVTTDGDTVISCVDCNGSDELKGTASVTTYDGSSYSINMCYKKEESGNRIEGSASYSSGNTYRKGESNYLRLDGSDNCVPYVDPYISDGYHCYKKVEHCASYYYSCSNGICYSDWYPLCITSHF